MNAETAYLFQHALLRDAAYQLQLPGERARLHRLALEIIEAVLEILPPDPYQVPIPESLRVDPAAAELAQHARMANTGEDDSLAMRELAYQLRSARWSERQARLEEAVACYDLVRGHRLSSPRLGLECNLNVMRLFIDAGTPAPGVERALDCMAQARKLRDPGAESSALNYRGLLRQQLARFDEAISDFEQAIALCREHAQPIRAAEFQLNLAGVQCDLGRTHEAAGIARQALEVFLKSGDKVSIGRGSGALAAIQIEMGDLVSAESGLLLSLGIHKDARDRRREAHTLGNLAILRHQQGRNEEAALLFRQAITTFLDVGDKLGAAIARTNLAGLLEGQSRCDEAQVELQLALDAHRESGNRYSESIVLGAIAHAAHDRGDWKAAERLFLESAALCRAINSLASLGRQLGNLGNLYADMGLPARALASYEQALGIHRQTGHRVSEAIVLGGMALLNDQQGRHAQAEAMFREALEIDVATQSRRPEGFHRCELGVCLMKQGDMASARAFWREGAQLLRTQGETRACEEKLNEMLAACKAAGIPPLHE